MRAAASARSRTPALNTVDGSKLSSWLAEPRGAPSLGRHAKDAPDAATAVVEISPPKKPAGSRGRFGSRAFQD
jgi:hypothetical protein